ncbi:60S ribosomal export protein NMD3 [Vulcanisaeta distributa]|uniref:NMD3 family protein n=1 Tax=Vulcanisaeta distributa (strain DSM 14429 / JCM 11212 / NBRC 100878 / IC-017) TaxID=572478 RepID=E1QQP0_VULDI|nr:60S ribosomal export protein NMD3 [Vulcanisaeta distributa]ADN51652.1 NMD3 family protein [Vulcanisaeta distributa DSM 14429]
MRKVCALCGRETDILIEGLCPDCYRKTHPLARVKRDVVGIVRCPSCGAILYRGRWVRDPKVIEKLILESIEYMGRVTNASIETLSLRHGLNTAVVKVRGSVHELISDYDEEVQVKVRYSEELCPRCRDMINERERAVVQIRSIIPMSGQLRRLIIDIVRKETIKDERSGFLRVEDVGEGFDIKLSDQGLARTIAYKIHKAVPSKVTESQSVVRGRGDKVVTKLSISVILVPLTRGSVIIYSNRPYYVLSYSQGTFKLMELGNREVINVKLGDIIKGNVAVPSYEARCIENQGLKALEIVIGSDRYVLNDMC